MGSIDGYVFTTQIITLPYFTFGQLFICSPVAEHALRSRQSFFGVFGTSACP